MNKKTLLLVAISIALLMIALFSHPNGTFIKLVYAADAYGNDIQYVEIWQWNGTVWILMHNLTASGGTYRINDNQPTKFVVNIKFNSTLATDQTQAIDYTRVYMNITAVWTNVELNNTSCVLVGGFYILKEQGLWNVTGQPQAGVTYACTVLYQGYY